MFSVSKEEQDEIDLLVYSDNEELIQAKLMHLNGKHSITKDSILGISCLKGNVKFVDFLLDQGSALEINIKDNNDTTPLMLASQSSLLKESLIICEKLIKHKAKVNKVDVVNWTSLHYACNNNNLPVARLLLENGAKTDIFSKYGLNCLHVALSDCNYDIVHMLLIEYGMNPLTLPKTEEPLDQVMDDTLEDYEKCKELVESVSLKWKELMALPENNIVLDATKFSIAKKVTNCLKKTFYELIFTKEYRDNKTVTIKEKEISKQVIEFYNSKKKSS